MAFHSAVQKRPAAQNSVDPWVRSVDRPERNQGEPVGGPHEEEHHARCAGCLSASVTKAGSRQLLPLRQNKSRESYRITGQQKRNVRKLAQDCKRRRKSPPQPSRGFRALQPAKELIQSECGAGRAGNVVGRQAGMPEDRRSAHQQQYGPESGSLAEPLTKPAPRPQERHHAGEHKERQRSDPGQGQASPVIILRIEDFIAFLEEDRFPLLGWFPPARRAQAVNKRAERGDDARQRRMAVLIGKRSLLQPFHAVGDVERLIVGAIENRIGCRDARHAYRDQNNHADNVFVHAVSRSDVEKIDRLTDSLYGPVSLQPCEGAVLPVVDVQAVKTHGDISARGLLG